MPLESVVQDVAGTRVTGNPRISVTGITLDSRRVRPGYVFAALRGENADGLAFVEKALARGAAAILSDRPPPPAFPGTWIQAVEPRAALARMARACYGRPDERIPVIGVTGTNGKTTVVGLLEAIVGASGGRAGVLGTISYQVGDRAIRASHTTPEADALFEYLDLMVSGGCSHAVMEVSSHGLAQARVLGVTFAAGIFTNLTQDHLDFHGTMERYFEAKSLLFRSLAPSAVAVLNADSPQSSRLASLTRARVVTFGASPRAVYRMGKVRSTWDGVRFDLVADGRALDVVSPLPGAPNASNVAAAIATALALGLPDRGVLEGVRSYPGAPGRFERIRRGQDFEVVVDYAHSPDALAGVLATLRALGPGRILTVFGCGGNRDRAKRPRMGEAAARGSDLVILTSDNPRFEDPEAIMDDAEAGIRSAPEGSARFRRIADRREAIAAAIALAHPGDAVLVAGKGHEEVQVLSDRTIPFDDRVVAAECLDRRLGRR